MKIDGVNYMCDKEATKFYGVTPSYFKNLRYNGTGPTYIRFHGRVFYKQHVVDQWFISWLEKEQGVK